MVPPVVASVPYLNRQYTTLVWGLQRQEVIIPRERCHPRNFSEWQTLLIQAELLCHEEKPQHFNKALRPISNKNERAASRSKYTEAHR